MKLLVTVSSRVYQRQLMSLSVSTQFLCCTSHNEFKTIRGLNRNLVKTQTFRLKHKKWCCCSIRNGVCLTECEITELTHLCGVIDDPPVAPMMR